MLFDDADPYAGLHPFTATYEDISHAAQSAILDALNDKQSVILDAWNEASSTLDALKDAWTGRATELSHRDMLDAWKEASSTLVDALNAVATAPTDPQALVEMQMAMSHQNQLTNLSASIVSAAYDALRKI